MTEKIEQAKKMAPKTGRHWLLSSINNAIARPDIANDPKMIILTMNSFSRFSDFKVLIAALPYASKITTVYTMRPPFSQWQYANKAA
jgi:hypothetical protein